jgi:hypothetical protein
MTGEVRDKLEEKERTGRGSTLISGFCVSFERWVGGRGGGRRRTENAKRKAPTIATDAG